MNSYNYTIYKLLKSAAEAPDAAPATPEPAATPADTTVAETPTTPEAPAAETPEVDSTATSNLYTDPNSPYYTGINPSDLSDPFGANDKKPEWMSAITKPAEPAPKPNEFEGVNIDTGSATPTTVNPAFAATTSGSGFMPTDTYYGHGLTLESNPTTPDASTPTPETTALSTEPDPAPAPAAAPAATSAPTPPNYNDPYYSTWSKERPADNTEEFNNELAEFDGQNEPFNQNGPGYMSQAEYDREQRRLSVMYNRLNNEDRIKYMNEFEDRQRALDEARWGKQPEYQPTPSVTGNPLDEYDATSPFMQHKKERDAYDASLRGETPDILGAPGTNKEVGELPDVGNPSSDTADIPVYPEYQEKLDAIDNNPRLSTYEKYQYRQQVLSANKEDFMKDTDRPLMPNELFRYRETHHSATGEPTVYKRHFTPGESFDEEYKPPESYKDPYGDYDFGNYSSMEQAISDLSDKLNAGEITQDEYNNQLGEIYSRQEIADYGGAFTGTDSKPKTVAGRPYYKGEPMTRGQISAYNHMGLGTLKNILEMQQHGRDLRDAGRAEGEEDPEGYSLGPNGAINYRLEY